MKVVGFILMAIGLGLIIFLTINYIAEKNKIHSPVPEDQSIKVIQISPKNP